MTWHRRPVGFTQLSATVTPTRLTDGSNRLFPSHQPTPVLPETRFWWQGEWNQGPHGAVQAVRPPLPQGSPHRSHEFRSALSLWLEDNLKPPNPDQRTRLLCQSPCPVPPTQPPASLFYPPHPKESVFLTRTRGAKGHPTQLSLTEGRHQV